MKVSAGFQDVGFIRGTVLFLILVFGGRMQARALPAQAAAATESQVNVRDTVARASNPNLPLSDRTSAFEQLFKAKTDERETAFRELVRRADQTVAVLAARQLLQARAPNVTSLITERISGWSEPNQLVVLETLQSVSGDAIFFDIPRQVIKDALRTVPPPAERASLKTPLDLAAMILADSKDPGDRLLLQNAALVRPRSRGVWLALAAAGDLSPQDVVEATSVYKDQSTASVVRLAAAAALAVKNPEMSTFATGEIRSFLSQFGNKDLATMLVQIESNPQAKQELFYFRENLRLLSTLRFLNTDSAEGLTFDFINAANDEIRVFLGLVAAFRWPERLLEVGQGRFSEAEYENLLAVVSLRHPRLTESVRAKMPAVRLDGALARLNESGLAGVFGVPASIALGF